VNRDIHQRDWSVVKFFGALIAYLVAGSVVSLVMLAAAIWIAVTILRWMGVIS
jgi:hypothetical protein